MGNIIRENQVADQRCLHGHLMKYEGRLLGKDGERGQVYVCYEPIHKRQIVIVRPEAEIEYFVFAGATVKVM